MEKRGQKIMLYLKGFTVEEKKKKTEERKVAYFKLLNRIFH